MLFTILMRKLKAVAMTVFTQEEKCAIWMIIQMTVFWTVCTQNYIAMRNLKCAIQMMVRTTGNCAIFFDANGSKGIQSTVCPNMRYTCNILVIRWASTPRDNNCAYTMVICNSILLVLSLREHTHTDRKWWYLRCSCMNRGMALSQSNYNLRNCACAAIQLIQVIQASIL